MANGELKQGDACPRCGGEFAAARVPTEEMRQRFLDRDIREPYPEGYDTVSVFDRERLGALFNCRDCSYQTRFPLKAAPAKKGAAKDAAE